MYWNPRLWKITRWTSPCTGKALWDFDFMMKVAAAFGLWRWRTSGPAMAWSGEKGTHPSYLLHVVYRRVWTMRWLAQKVIHSTRTLEKWRGNSGCWDQFPQPEIKDDLGLCSAWSRVTWVCRNRKSTVFCAVVYASVKRAYLSFFPFLCIY
jgi:hypothetical protein